MGMVYEYDLADQVAMFGAEHVVQSLTNQIQAWGGQE